MTSGYVQKQQIDNDKKTLASSSQPKKIQQILHYRDGTTSRNFYLHCGPSRKESRVVRNYNRDNNNRNADNNYNNSNDDQLIKESLITVTSMTLMIRVNDKS